MRRNGGKRVAEATIQTIEIDAPPQECFDVAADLAAYPEWAVEVRRVEIHERDTDGRPARVTLTVDAMIRQVSTTFRYVYDPPRSMSWAAEPGPDIEELEGSYEFNPVDGGTSVVYALRVVPAFDIPGFLRRQAEKQLVGTALRGLRRRVEEQARRAVASWEGGVKPFYGPSTDDIVPVQRKTGRCSPPF